MPTRAITGGRTDTCSHKECELAPCCRINKLFGNFIHFDLINLSASTFNSTNPLVGFFKYDLELLGIFITLLCLTSNESICRH